MGAKTFSIDLLDVTRLSVGARIPFTTTRNLLRSASTSSSLSVHGVETPEIFRGSVGRTQLHSRRRALAHFTAVTEPADSSSRSVEREPFDDSLLRSTQPQDSGSGRFGDYRDCRTMNTYGTWSVTIGPNPIISILTRSPRGTPTAIFLAPGFVQTADERSRRDVAASSAIPRRSVLSRRVGRLESQSQLPLEGPSSRLRCRQPEIIAVDAECRRCGCRMIQDVRGIDTYLD